MEGILVGYDSQSTAYRCYMKANKKIIISRDVQFDEDFEGFDADQEGKIRKEQMPSFEQGDPSSENEYEMEKQHEKVPPLQTEEISHIP